MHTIEPFYLWRDYYRSENDELALNYGKQYSEFHFTDKVYNYVIHPQWDSIGSQTLFYKQLYTDYQEGFVIIQLIGEWNDVIENDIMTLKRELIDDLIYNGISNFILLMDHVLNFHFEMDDYYAEWKDEIAGEIFLVNCLPQVEDELYRNGLNTLLSFGETLQGIFWQTMNPSSLKSLILSNNRPEENSKFFLQ